MIKKNKPQIRIPEEVAENAGLKFPEVVIELPKSFASYNPREGILTVNLRDSEAAVQVLTFGLDVKVEKIVFDFGDERVEMSPEEWKEFLKWFFENNIRRWRKE